MKHINTQAPVLCSKEIAINASPERVWAVLTDIDQWPKWQSDIGHSKLNGALAAGSTFVWKTGGVKIVSTLHTVEHGRAFGWTGKTFGLFAIHNWRLEQRANQTVVSVDESMEGLLAILLKKSFNKNLETGMLKWLELLKAVCEKV